MQGWLNTWKYNHIFQEHVADVVGKYSKKQAL